MSTLEKQADLYTFCLDELELIRQLMVIVAHTQEEKEIFCYASITDLLSYLRDIHWERDDVKALLESALDLHYPVLHEHS